MGKTIIKKNFDKTKGHKKMKTLKWAPFLLLLKIFVQKKKTSNTLITISPSKIFYFILLLFSFFCCIFLLRFIRGFMLHYYVCGVQKNIRELKKIIANYVYVYAENVARLRFRHEEGWKKCILVSDTRIKKLPMRVYYFVSWRIEIKKSFWCYSWCMEKK